MSKYYYKEVDSFFNFHAAPSEIETYYKSLYSPNQLRDMDPDIIKEYAIRNFYATSLAYAAEDMTLEQLWNQEIENAEKTISREKHDAGILIDTLVNQYPAIAEQLLAATGNIVFRNEDFDYVRGATDGHSLYTYYHFVIDIDWSHLTLEVRGL